jgi:DNA-binding beta-propeller fold protein YncE
MTRSLVCTVVTVCALASACFDPDHLPEMTFAIDAKDTWRAPPGPGAPAPGEGRALVTNNLDDTVSILDLDSLEAGAPEVLDTVPVGFVPVEREGPHHCAIDAEAKHAYVGISNYVPGSGSGPHGQHGNGTADGHIIKIDVATGRFVDSVRIDRNPGDVRLTPDGKKLVATHFDQLKIIEADRNGITSGPELDARLVIVDVASFERDAFIDVCPAPHGVTITSDSRRAISSCTDDTAAVVDLEAHTVTRVTLLDEPGPPTSPVCEPYAMTLDETAVAGGGPVRAWVSCYKSGQLIAVDVAAAERAGHTLQLPGPAVFGSVFDTTMVVAFQGENDGVAVVDLADPAQPGIREVRSLAGECVRPHFARFSDDGASIFVVCEGNKADPGSVMVLDASPGLPALGSVEVGRFPDDITFARRAE